MLEVDELMLITSAPNLLPAISKEVLVLVEASKNKLTIVLPFNVDDDCVTISDREA